MSAHTQYFLRTFRNLMILGLIALGANPSPLFADVRSCATVIPLAAGETWRDSGHATGDAVCFDLELDAAGIAALELSTSATAARARLSLLAPEEGATAAVQRLKQSATSLIFAADAGSYRLRVEAEDPRQPLPTFRLRSRFIDEGAKSETDSELEAEPDPLTALPIPARCGAKSETDSELEAEPDPLAAGPIAELYDLSGARKSLGKRLRELCRQGETDDHGDGFVCATPFAWGDSIAAEIGNDWGDDGDVFRFRLSALRAVEIRAHGDAELVAELYDRHGQRLDLAVGDGDGLRRVRTLAPGAYFLRLEGRDGAAGRYSLRIGPPRG